MYSDLILNTNQMKKEVYIKIITLLLAFMIVGLSFMQITLAQDVPPQTGDDITIGAPATTDDEEEQNNSNNNSGNGNNSGTGGNNSGRSPNLLCRIFPFIYQIDFTKGLCGTESDLSAVAGLVQFLLSMIFVGIIAIAIFFIIKSAIKYIRSEGDEGKVEEAKKALKAVFIGILTLIGGLVGLLIVISFIGAQDALDQDIENNSSIGKTFKELTGI